MQVECCLRGHSFPVTALESNGDDLYSGDLGGSIVVWNLQLRRPRLLFKASQMAILQIKITREFVCIQARDDIISIWSVGDDAQLVKFVKCDSLKFCCFDVNSDGNLVYIFQDKFVVYDIHDGVELQAFDVPVGNGAVMCLKSTEFGTVVGTEDGSVITLNGGKKTIVKAHNEPILTLDYVGDVVASAGASDQLIQSRVNEISNSVKLPGPGVAKLIFFKNDDELIKVCGCWDGSLIIVNQLTIIKIIKEHRKSIQSLIVNTKSRRVFAGGEDCKITVYKY